MSDTPTTILVVDDDLFTAELTGLVLEGSGYETTIAEGALDAMEKISQNPAIAMVVSDLNMPFMDGVQLFSELRGQGFTQPFVLLTGSNADALRAAHPDIDAVVAKDEDLQEKLPLAVDALLGRA
ncbi:response regulator [Geomesophilobacter sediminis]|uniref:Response regulator n=1 Tax=Geomesophilobacter sediminis TaxID=2798584 RepID=A0A8J7M2F0_9BACT|nr:response regulator [Geomesophilobacter sediminis]MBJ6727141.1 response regulator [Geomesophilobacter sediminis]